MVGYLVLLFDFVFPLHELLEVNSTVESSRSRAVFVAAILNLFLLLLRLILSSERKVRIKAKKRRIRNSRITENQIFKRKKKEKG